MTYRWRLTVALAVALIVGAVASVAHRSATAQLEPGIPFEGDAGEPYVLASWKWNHLAVTHTCNPTVNAAIAMWVAASGLQDGGCGTDIVFKYEPIGTGAIGLAGITTGPGGFTTQCQVIIAPTHATNIIVSAHEIGHCHGLLHSEVYDAVMYYAYHRQPALHADDIAAIQALYGPPSGATPIPTPPAGTATPPPTQEPTATPSVCVGLACVTRTATVMPTATPTPATRRLVIPEVARD